MNSMEGCFIWILVYCFLPFHKPGCLFRFPLCTQYLSMAPHQGFWDSVKPSPHLGGTKYSGSCPRGKEDIVRSQSAGWLICLLLPTFFNLGRRDPGWVSLEQTVPTVSLSLLAGYPRRWRTLKPGTNPVFLRGSAPGEQRSTRMECVCHSPLSALGCELVVTFQRGPSGEKPSSVLQGLPSCWEWMPHVPLIWDRSCLTACG